MESGDDLLELANFINVEINKMAAWFRANKLVVNISKTKYMIFRSKGKKNVTEPVIVYSVNEPNHSPNNDLITVLARYQDTINQVVTCFALPLLCFVIHIRNLNAAINMHLFIYLFFIIGNFEGAKNFLNPKLSKCSDFWVKN